jgi:hypothetical protein
MTEQQTTAQQPPEQEPQGAPASDATDELVVGPIDYLALELPGAKMNGEGMSALLDLVDRGIIQILDLRAAMVSPAGDVTAIEIADLDGDGQLDLAMFTGVRSGLLGDDDVAASAELIEPGNAVAVILYENTWARPFVTAMRHVGAEVIASSRIPAADVIELLDALEAEEEAEQALADSQAVLNKTADDS